MTDDLPPASLPRDTTEMRLWHEQANPGHYRLIALYLQVLREVLPGSVDQAVFQLATQLHPARYAALSAERRRRLHQRLAELVLGCSSLLTVEQLAGLAARRAQRRQAVRRQRQRQLVQRLIGATASVAPRQRGSGAQPPDGSASGPQSAGPPQGPDPGDPPGPLQPPLPPGSVRLGMELPLQADRFGWAGDDGDAEASDENDATEGLDAQEQDVLRELLAGHQGDLRAFLEQEVPDPLAGGWAAAASRRIGDEPGGREDGPDASSPENFSPEDFSAEVDSDEDFSPGDDSDEVDSDEDNAAETVFAGSDEDHEAEDPAVDRPERVSGRREVAAGASLAPEAILPFATEAILPRDPHRLELWLEGLEAALSLRLRRLSHAINSELMRCGLLPLLLPASLLDAVLEGRVETLGAAPNLLRLQLPMALPGAGVPLQPTVLLLRCADLELDQPRLRRLRRELQRRRQEGRRMALHHRRLQRRLQAREAEALWLQDIRTRQQGSQAPAEGS